MSMLSRLGALLKVRTDEVESVLRHDEQRAQETIRRRAFLGAAAALATAPFVPNAWVQLPKKKVLTYDIGLRWVLAPAALGIAAAYHATRQ